MRPLHRPKVPSIDYRDRPRTNVRLLGGTLLLGISIGAAGVLLASMTRPQPRATKDAVSEPDGSLVPSNAAPAHEASAAVAPARTGSVYSDAKDDRAAAALAAYKATEMRNALSRQAAALRGCYDAFLADEPDVAEGKVTIDFQIDPDGKVLAPGIVESELEGDALADCLVARVAGFAFPPPPDHRKAYAAHTFYFKKDAAL